MEAGAARGSPEGTAPSRGRSARSLSTSMPPDNADDQRSASYSYSPTSPPHLAPPPLLPVLLLAPLILDPNSLLRTIEPLNLFPSLLATLFPSLAATPRLQRVALALSLGAPVSPLLVPLPLLQQLLQPLASAAPQPPLFEPRSRSPSPSPSPAPQSLTLLRLAAGLAQGGAAGSASSP